jgi:hypothetical protein
MQAGIAVAAGFKSRVQSLRGANGFIVYFLFFVFGLAVRLSLSVHGGEVVLRVNTKPFGRIGAIQWELVPSLLS